MPTFDELENRISHHTPDDAQIIGIKWMREYALKWSKFIAYNVPPGREQSLALTKIEEALFWANAGIARSSNYEEELSHVSKDS